MSDASRADAVIDALLEQLPAPLATVDRPDGYQVTVREGWPNDVVEHDHVIISDHTIEQEPANLGGRVRKETVVINLEILVVRPDEDATAARHGAYEIAAALATWSASNVTVDGTACEALFTVTRYIGGLKDTARAGALRCALTVKTRLAL